MYNCPNPRNECNEFNGLNARHRLSDLHGAPWYKVFKDTGGSEGVRNRLSQCQLEEQAALEQFQSAYSSEEACRQALFDARWPKGYQCSRCNGTSAYLLETRSLWQCVDCQYQGSITAGTVLEGTKTPLTKWFLAIYLISRPAGINALSLSKQIQVTYKTAWLMHHRIRAAMDNDLEGDLLKGIVRCNAAVYGKKMFSDPYCPKPGEYRVIIGGESDAQGVTRHIRVSRLRTGDDGDSGLNTVSGPVTERNIGSRIHIGKRVLNVELSEMEHFRREHVEATCANVRLEYLRASRTRFIDLIAIVKNMTQWIYRTYISIGSKYLDTYLNEYCFRYRAAHASTGMFNALIGVCASQAKKSMQSHRSATKYPYTAA